MQRCVGLVSCRPVQHRASHAHPTLVEILQEAALAASGGALHG